MQSKEQAEFSRENLSQKDLARLAMDTIHRNMVHHVFMFKEVEHQMGFDAALKMLDGVYAKSSQAHLTRLGKLFGFQLDEGIPQPLLEMPKEKLIEFITSLSLNWLATDGLWFQEIEFEHGMFDAKRCNDSLWAWFSPFEAWSIKRLLQLPEQSGLEGLKKALQMRIYAAINVQSIIDESPHSIVFQMNDCRVQSARKRKGLDDYACKSAGLVEYTNFARTIDSRIKTECIACPPDQHPAEWFCAWRFSIEA